jgi:putative transposase
VVEVCEAFGISRQAYYAAQAPESERPRRRAESPRAGISTPDLLERIRAVVARCAAWGVRKVWAYLRHIEKVVVSRRRVWKVMKAHGLVLPASGPERRENLPRGQVVVPQSNRRWATDLTTQATVRDGVIAIVPVVDCGDRVVLAIELTKSQEAPAVLRPVERALENAFDTPRDVPDGLELRSDHGPQYTGADAEALCRDWGLVHTFAPVARPTGNAVAERLIQTLKVELLWTRDWESLDELHGAIAEWVIRYNEERPHQSLAWRTPAEQRALNLNPPLERAA